MEETFEDICRSFLNSFAENVKLNDQLPVNMAGYNILLSELPGELISWCHQYLTEKKCPVQLLTPIIIAVKNRIEKLIQNDASSCGFDGVVYNPIRLMQKVIMVLNEVCLELLDNDKLLEILKTVSTVKYPLYAVTAVKNSRKKMEDRHICINDFNRLYSLEDTEPMSFYAVFDGHGGTIASSYSVANFHNFLAENSKLARRADEALREAFLTTDKYYSEKSVEQNLTSGTTALCALYKQKEKKLFVGWLGDSQALLVKKGKLWQIVEKHSPDKETERKRIEQLGGIVIKYGGIWRVQGQLAVARAIGPASYKPFVSNQPDLSCIELDGEEDFLIMGCDGLWDHLSEDEVAISVYHQIKLDSKNLNLVTQKLVESAKCNGSSDNITVIVIFLKDPKEIVEPDCIAEAIQEKETIEQNNAISLENRILDELKLRNVEMCVLDNPLECTSSMSPSVIDSEKKDSEKEIFEISVDNTNTDIIIGDSGCEDSEDEWDFIKVDKKENTDTRELKHLEYNCKDTNICKFTNTMSTEALDSHIIESSLEIKADLIQSDLLINEDKQAADKEVQRIEQDIAEDGDASLESTLNPAAKEFVPLRSQPTSPEVTNPNLLLDDVIAQSPRKGVAMENINIPTEVEFDNEVSCRPHETETSNDFINSENGDILNPKEASQCDEKLADDYLVDENGTEPTNLISFDRFNEPDAMNESFYEENPKEELNKIQPLPANEENDELVINNDETLKSNETDTLIITDEKPETETLETAAQQVAFELQYLLSEAKDTAMQTIQEKKQQVDISNNLQDITQSVQTITLVENVSNLCDEDTNNKNIVQQMPDLLIPETSVDITVSPTQMLETNPFKIDDQVEMLISNSFSTTIQSGEDQHNIESNEILCNVNEQLVSIKEVNEKTHTDIEKQLPEVKEASIEENVGGNKMHIENEVHMEEKSNGLEIICVDGSEKISKEITKSESVENINTIGVDDKNEINLMKQEESATKEIMVDVLKQSSHDEIQTEVIEKQLIEAIPDVIPKQTEEKKITAKTHMAKTKPAVGTKDAKKPLKAKPTTRPVSGSVIADKEVKKPPVRVTSATTRTITSKTSAVAPKKPPMNDDVKKTSITARSTTLSTSTKTSTVTPTKTTTVTKVTTKPASAGSVSTRTSTTSRTVSSKVSTEISAGAKIDEKRSLSAKTAGVSSRVTGTTKPVVTSIRKTTTVTKKPEDKASLSSKAVPLQSSTRTATTALKKTTTAARKVDEKVLATKAPNKTVTKKPTAVVNLSSKQPIKKDLENGTTQAENVAVTTVGVKVTE